jgi:RNA polymerase sigma-70 factor (ECF subfamily)
MTVPAEDIARWLPLARAGSREALGELFEAHRAYLLLVANRQLDPVLRAKGGASDLVQETFFEAQRDFAGFEGKSADELQAWLKQLLLHNLANFARSYRQTTKRAIDREIPLELETPSGKEAGQMPSDTPSPSGQAMAQEQTQMLQAVLQRLPEDYRQVITWRYQEGRSFAEIAERFQRSENAVRKLWFRAVERLEQELGKPS